MDQTDHFGPLLRRVAGGDKAAMKTCLQVFGDLVWSMAIKQLPAADAEETVQDIFLEIWEKADRFDPSKGKAVTYIALIARRRILDRVRALSRAHDRRRTHEGLTQADLVIPAREHDGDRIDSLEAIYRQLQNLPESQQRAIDLVVARGYTQAEAAASLDLPLGTLKSQVRRGLQAIRKNLNLPNPAASAS